MSGFTDRYSSAVHSGNLKSDPNRETALDVVGAAGLAARRSPLAVALLRLFVGDDREAEQIVTILENMAVGKAYRLGIEITRPEARDMGKAVLAWHREGVCKPCGGHGFDVQNGSSKVGQGRAVLSATNCKFCRGTGKILFDRQFPITRLELARWLLAEIEREQAVAGPSAMAALAPKLDL